MRRIRLQHFFLPLFFSTTPLSFSKEIVLIIEASPSVKSFNFKPLSGIENRVHKYATDGWAKTYQSKNKNVVIIRPESPESKKNGFIDEEDFREQVEQKIDPNDRITHLVILDHGSFSQVSGHGQPGINLSFVGHYSQSPPSESVPKLESITFTRERLPLSILRENFSESVHIALIACNALKGKETEVRASVQSFFKYLGISNGTLYGSRAVTTIIPTIDHPWKNFWRTCIVLGLCTTPLFFSSIDWVRVIPIFTALPSFTFLILSILSHLEPGLLLKIQNGQVVSEQATRRGRNQQEVWGFRRNCAIALQKH